MIVDNNWSRFNSKYPFAALANLLLILLLFPNSCIRGLLIQASLITGYFISKIQVTLNSSIQIYFQPTNATSSVLHCTIKPKSLFAFIIDTSNIIRGNISYTDDFYNNMLALIFKLDSKYLLNLSFSVLPIDSSCIYLYRLNNTQYVAINNVLYTLDINLYFVNNTLCTYAGKNKYTVNIYGDCPQGISDVSQNNVCTKLLIKNKEDNKVFSYNLAEDSYVIIKSSGLSDARVITNGSVITIKGVKDV